MYFQNCTSFLYFVVFLVQLTRGYQQRQPPSRADGARGMYFIAEISPGWDPLLSVLTIRLRREIDDLLELLVEI